MSPFKFQVQQAQSKLTRRQCHWPDEGTVYEREALPTRSLPRAMKLFSVLWLAVFSAATAAPLTTTQGVDSANTGWVIVGE